VIREGEVERYLNIIAWGLVRKYLPVRNREITVQLASEGHIIHSELSFHYRIPSRAVVETIEPTVFFLSPMTACSSLYEQFPKAERMGRLMISDLFIKKDNRYFDQLKRHPGTFPGICEDSSADVAAGAAEIYRLLSEYQAGDLQPAQASDAAQKGQGRGEREERLSGATRPSQANDQHRDLQLMPHGIHGLAIDKSFSPLCPCEPMTSISACPIPGRCGRSRGSGAGIPAWYALKPFFPQDRLAIAVQSFLVLSGLIVIAFLAQHPGGGALHDMDQQVPAVLAALAGGIGQQFLVMPLKSRATAICRNKGGPVGGDPAGGAWLRRALPACRAIQGCRVI
jgi:hypothetical protein